jgi:Flp pilus assembly protein TadD
MPERGERNRARRAVGRDPLADLGELAGVLRRVRVEEHQVEADATAVASAQARDEPDAAAPRPDANGAPRRAVRPPAPTLRRQPMPRRSQARETPPPWPEPRAQGGLWRSDIALKPAHPAHRPPDEAPAAPGLLEPAVPSGSAFQPWVAAPRSWTPVPGGATSSAPAEEPVPLESLYEEAKRHAAEGRYTNAIELYQQVLRRDPENVRARNNLGFAYDCRGEFDLAINEYVQALELEPRNVQVYCNLGAVYGERGWYEKAEEVLKQALRLDPKNAEAHCNLGIVYCKKGMYHLATAELKRAVELEADYVQAFYYLGECFNHLDRHDEAIAAFERALQGQPHSQKAYYNLGILYDKKKMPERAKAMYRRARELQGLPGLA